MLHLRNPHSVLAVLETRPQDVQQILLPGRGNDLSEAWARVERKARESRIPVNTGGGAASGQRSKGGRDREGDGRTSAAEALVREREPLALEELFKGAAQKAGGKGLWLALDSLQDPHNVGAIFRASAFFGVQGILLTQERSAPISATAYDVATGGLEYVPFSTVVNLQRAFEVAKESGLWILGTSEHATDDLSSVQRDRPWLLVFGNEEKGMRRLTEESCDVLCRISPKGQVTSLNVSVAAGIFISTLTA